MQISLTWWVSGRIRGETKRRGEVAPRGGTKIYSLSRRALDANAFSSAGFIVLNPALSQHYFVSAGLVANSSYFSARSNNSSTIE